ncbi:PP2C family protein-serine/threonine phosphatase [Occallatibacter savannae]|uniref:PP2C family protein-serine/threonine phosphatase n=1 Tax=Occallatibacter savannae TaxID=1002691 RepID=UPI0013A54FFC|nr:SpoIIE family protein phosphatase [Occallatibacter savannae]
MAELNGPWSFHTGDDPAWADPEFNDSSWSRIEAARSYEEQGFKGYSGTAWYRLRVNLPQWNGPLALEFPVVADSYQVFVNGRQIGQVGSMPPHESVVLASQMIFPIPPEIDMQAPLNIAVRVWHWHRFSAYEGGGLEAPPRIGTLATITEWQQTQKHARYWVETDATISLLANLLTAFAGLALFALRPKEREYLWFGAAQVVWAVQVGLHIALVTRTVPFLAMELAIASTVGLAMILNVEFFVTLLSQRKRVLYWSAVVSAMLLVFTLGPSWLDWFSDAQYSTAQMLLEFIYGACVTAMFYAGVRQGNIEAKLLVAPFTFSFVCNTIEPLMALPIFDRVAWLRAFSARFDQLTSWPFPFRTVVLAGDIAMFSVVAVLVFRYARSRTDEERMSGELAAARAVQQVLVPERIPTVPGFEIECVYEPAGDVGGDFFQIIPLSGCELLVVIGDVSGKGMPAAMTVSLLVGMVRTLAQTIKSPGEILSAINHNMMGRTSGGFTTCLILHISDDGAVTAANAGHLAPYLNGRELHIENGLPLGLASSAEYVESHFEVAPADRLTLLTDGVLEARSANGELLGFERAASMSTESAARIAAAAQRFGQEDDITVLSLTRRSSCSEGLQMVEAASA